jgi:hypothetical protein
MVALFDSSRLIGELKVANTALWSFIDYPSKVAGVVPHCIAILCTIFRLIYRIWTCRFWWEDAWAAFALILDGIVSLYGYWPAEPTNIP